MSKKPIPKIICVDDEPRTLEALERVLRPDFTVLTAATAREALDLLTAHPDCAIVLSDQRMPGMTGLELLREVKKIAPDTVRAIMSGHMDLQEMSEAINGAWIHRFILKPWDNEYLRVQMLEAVANHALLHKKSVLEKLSITDPVTQLTNHRYFQDNLKKECERALRHGRPLSLAMIDIDGFKAFNDQHGHPDGDRLLHAVAQRIQAEVRRIDIVSRYGGEEFGVILPDTGLDEGHHVAERVRRAVADMDLAAYFPYEARATISVGVATLPDHARAPSALLAAADQALYQAKRQGRNRTVAAAAAANSDSSP